MRLVPAQRPVETGEPVFADPGYVDAQLDIPITGALGVAGGFSSSENAA
jgi:hypothetical protein